MQNLKTLFLVCFSAVALIGRSQDPTAIQTYISTYRDLAILEMERTGVPAAIKLAQGIHETSAGTSVLVLKSNNHFGIKCKANWNGESVSHDDDARGECFRKYPSAERSYRDHSDFLRNSERYAFLFQLDPTDYEGWARGLKKAGYATNPKYAQVIIRIIEQYGLQDYTLIALGRKPRNDQKDLVSVATTPMPVQTHTQPVTAVFAETEEQKSIVKEQKPVIRDEPQYPATEFRINETRVIFARKGTSFLAIAEQYQVPLARIFEFNELSPAETVDRDQLIYLQRKRKTGNTEFHIVREGESLQDIAQLEAIRLESLLELNLLQKQQRPAVGERLFLRSKAPVAPMLAAQKPTPSAPVFAYSRPPHENSDPNYVVCTVQAKETIYAIARRFGVSIGDIVKWNQLEGHDLRVGQQLKIYK